MASKIKNRIIDQAICCFAKHGYSGCSTKEIATRADVTEGSLFRLFGTKEKLYVEALERVRSGWLSQKEFESLLNSGDIETGIKNAYAAMMRKLTENGHRLIRFAMLEHISHARTIFSPIYDVRIRAVAKRLREGIESGHVRKDVDPKLAASAIHAVVGNLRFYSMLLKRSRKQELVMVQRSIDLWLHGVLK